jgi:hypothetical protein
MIFGSALPMPKAVGIGTKNGNSPDSIAYCPVVKFLDTIEKLRKDSIK